MQLKSLSATLAVLALAGPATAANRRADIELTFRFKRPRGRGDACRARRVRAGEPRGQGRAANHRLGRIAPAVPARGGGRGRARRGPYRVVGLAARHGGGRSPPARSTISWNRSRSRVASTTSSRPSSRSGPTATSTACLGPPTPGRWVYRTDVLEAAGISEIPRTWEALRDASRTIHEKTRQWSGSVLPGGSGPSNTNLVPGQLFLVVERQCAGRRRWRRLQDRHLRRPDRRGDGLLRLLHQGRPQSGGHAGRYQLVRSRHSRRPDEWRSGHRDHAAAAAIQADPGRIQGA